ncbi:MAG: TonB-dependent siderophore receptor [Nitrosomonas sp.]|nr:TonB-dependent siderophore receptor [Nitrosomonas sp.]MCW5607431.1 TonB-dependent siderophore receptor [Nitrosomonas sp.]
MNWIRSACWIILLIGVTGFAGAQSESLTRPQEKNKNAQETTKLPEITIKDSVSSAESFTPKTTSTATKTNIPLIEIPQTVNVITRSELDARLTQTISDAVVYTPGILTGLYGDSTRDDYFQSRGFEATQFLDGLGLVGSNYANLRIEPYGMESVEILKGPSSTMYGLSGPGGLIHMTSKRPTAVPVRELFITGGSYDRIQGGLDIGGPVDNNGRLFFRLTGLVRNSNTQVQHAHLDRYFIAPSVTWRLGTDTTLTLLSHYQRDDTGNAMMFLPPEGSLLPNPNGKISTRTFHGEPGYDHYKRDQYAVGYAFDHRFNDAWSFQQNLRYADVKSDYPNIFSLGFALDENGDPIDFRTLDRVAAHYKDKAGTFTMDSRMHGKFNTGPVQHNLLVGVDYRHMSGTNRRGFSEDFLFIDAFDPVYGQDFARPVIDFIRNQNLDQVGLYAQNQMKYDRFLLTLGVRNDWAQTRTRDNDMFFDEQTSTRQNDRAFTYRTGLTYLFDNGIAPYASYAESFQPSPGATFDGAPLRPTTGRQYEVGVKYKPVNYNALMSVAAYHLKQRDVLTPDLTPGHTGYFVQTGEVRVRGIEAEVKANVMDGLNFIGAYSFADSNVSKSNDPEELGNRLALTPRHQVSGWLDYTFYGNRLAGLGLAWGVRHIGSNFGDIVNSLKAPSYTLFDAAVRYDLRHVHPTLRGAQLSVNMNNIFDNEYVSTCASGACYYGLRRTVYATLRYGF